MPQPDEMCLLVQMADAPQALAFPLCDGAADGDTCFWTAPSGKGSVLYDDYSDCARRDLLLPGFELLPDWILASVLLPVEMPLCSVGAAPCFPPETGRGSGAALVHTTCLPPSHQPQAQAQMYTRLSCIARSLFAPTRRLRCCHDLIREAQHARRRHAGRQARCAHT